MLEPSPAPRRRAPTPTSSSRHARGSLLERLDGALEVIAAAEEMTIDHPLHHLSQREGNQAIMPVETTTAGGALLDPGGVADDGLHDDDERGSTTATSSAVSVLYTNARFRPRSSSTGLAAHDEVHHTGPEEDRDRLDAPRPHGLSPSEPREPIRVVGALSAGEPTRPCSPTR